MIVLSRERSRAGKFRVAGSGEQTLREGKEIRGCEGCPQACHLLEDRMHIWRGLAC